MKQQIRFCRGYDGTRIAFAVTGHGPPHAALGPRAALAHPPRVRVAEPDLAALARPRSPPGARWCAWTSAAAACPTAGVETISFEAFVRDLEAVVDAAGLERFALFGHSQGGAIAMEYAVRHPERVIAPRAARRLRARPLQALAGEPQRIRGAAQAGRVRLGRRRSVVPAVLRQPVHAGRVARAAAPDERAAARVVLGVGRGAHPARASTRSTSPRRCRASPARPWCCMRAATCAFRSRRGARLAAMIPGARFVPLESDNHILLEQRAGVRRPVRGAARVPRQRAAASAASPRARRRSWSRSRRAWTTRRSRRASSCPKRPCATTSPASSTRSASRAARRRSSWRASADWDSGPGL